MHHSPAAPNPDHTTPHEKRETFDPHKLVGVIVVYGLAVHSGIMFLHWLAVSLLHEFGH